ncbi:MAG: hypothetical protein QME52_13315 [Bacteroidota bacterium]|nr:hypothetical protein [Bacteroidota bacterium]
MAIDPQGNIFVLSGDYSKNPFKDVFVFDKRGIFITKFTLPNKSGILYIDPKGYLYTREKERTLVKKYKIEYLNF